MAVLTTRSRIGAQVAAACACLPLAALSLLPFWGWVPVNGVPAGLAVAALFALTLWRPADGLAVLAGLLVLGMHLGVLLGAETSLQEPLLLAFLGGWLARAAITDGLPSGGEWRVLLPVFVFAATVATSALVQVLAAQSLAPSFWSYLQGVLADLARHYLTDPAAVATLRAAAPMLEGAGLFVAVVRLCRDRESVERVLRMAVVSAAAVAALDVARFISIPLRAGVPLIDGLRAARGVRISVLGDYNAVGSYLAMMLLAALGFAVARRRTRIGWSLMAALILVAVWLTGSRAALLAVPLGLLAFPILLAGRSVRRGWWLRLAVYASGLAIVVVAIARLAPPDAGLRPVSNMIRGRLEMARVSLQIVREAPIFGVGLGRFLPRSARYVRFADAGVSRENAHNNFLQILAELGVIGLATFAWILVATARRLRHAVHCRDALAAGVATGLLAFLFTCLAGHPLLTRTVSYGFWLVLGVAAALVPAADGVAGLDSDRGWSRTPRAAWLAATMLLALVTLSIPWRTTWLVRREADLEHVSSGFSDWRTEGDGTSYRTVAHDARLYVHRGVCRIVVPVRSDGKRDVVVELRLNGRLANRVRAAVGSWTPVVMLVPENASGERFRPLQIRVDGANAARVGIIDMATCGRR